MYKSSFIFLRIGIHLFCTRFVKWPYRLFFLECHVYCFKEKEGNSKYSRWSGSRIIYRRIRKQSRAWYGVPTSGSRHSMKLHTELVILTFVMNQVVEQSVMFNSKNGWERGKSIENRMSFFG